METKGKSAENTCACGGSKTVTSYCQKCSQYICKDCHVTTHLGHDAEVVDLAEKATRFLWEYQRLLSTVSLISDRRQIHIKQESIKGIIEELKGRLARTKREFQEDVQKSLEGTLSYLPTSPLVREFERQKMELGGDPDNPVDNLREDLSKICSSLLHQIKDSKYESADKFLESKDLKKYQDELEQINRLSAGDMDYIRELGKLKRTSIQYSYNPMTILGMIRVNSEVKRPDRLIQIDREKNTLNIYHVKTKAVVKTQVNSSFIIPYRFVSIEAQGNLYLIGGDNDHNCYLRSVYLYDEIRGVLIALEEMTEARSRHALSSEGNLIFATGGENVNGVLSSCEQYDCKENGWKDLPRLHSRRCGHSSCAVDGHVYVGFGWDKDYLDSVERLKVDGGDSWQRFKVAKLDAPPLQICGMAAIGKHEVLVFGGYKEGEKLSNEVFAINVKENTWKRKREMPEEEAFIGSETKVLDGTVYSFGYTKGGMYSYDVRRDEWEFTEQSKLTS